MQTARRLIVALSYSIVVWVFSSVAGALLDPAHAAFWSASLMWSFLSTLLVAPALVMIYDASTHATRQRRTAAAQAPVSIPDDAPSPSREADAASRPAPTPSPAQRPTPNTSHWSFVEDASAAYPVPEELEARPAAEDENRPEWAGAYAV